MISILILLAATVALLHFFVAYCRSLVAVYSEVPISEEALQWAELVGGKIRGAEFGRIVKLIGMCPERGDDGLEVAAVRIYYFLLSVLHLAEALMPATRPALETQRAACTHFAVVALDRRIHSRGLA